MAYFRDLVLKKFTNETYKCNECFLLWGTKYSYWFCNSSQASDQIGMIYNILDNGEAMVKFGSNSEKKLHTRHLTKVHTGMSTVLSGNLIHACMCIRILHC